MNYFFHREPFSIGASFTLSEDEGRHAVKVLRLAVGNFIHIINGMGEIAEAEISDIKSGKVGIVLQKVKTEDRSSCHLTIALAVLKKRERMEWFVEKAVELAATKIILYSSRHSEKSHVGISRIQKIAISALKQSGNLWLPEIVSDIDFKDIISEPFAGQLFIAHCREEQKPLLKDAYTSRQNAIILIGPEGDFSEDEIKQSYQKGFNPVSLGNLRLRAETAALAALMTLQIANQKA